MKRILILLLLLISSTAFAGNVCMMGGGTVSGGGNLIVAGTTATHQSQGGWGTSWIATSFIPSTSGTITGGTLRLSRDSGASTWTETLCLYAADVASPYHPTTQIGTCSSSVAASSIPETTEGDAAFTGMSAAFVADTRYWLVLHRSATDGLSVSWYGPSSGATLTNISSTSSDGFSSADGATWSSDITVQPKFNLTY